MLNKLKIRNLLFSLYIIFFSVSISYFSGEGNRNLLLIYFMSLTPIILFTIKKIDKTDFLLIFFILIIVLTQYFAYSETLRWSTIIFTLIFCFAFIAYKRLIHFANISFQRYQSLVKFLIYSFFVVLIIQQFCVIANLPIFNVSNYNSEIPFKLNSLTSEPSHTSFYLSLLMYTFILTREYQFNNKYNFIKLIKVDFYVWVCFFWCMISTFSAAGIFYLFVVLLKLLNNIIFTILFISFYGIFNFLNLESFSRIQNTLNTVLTLEPEKIIDADKSISYRIVPTLYAFKIIDLNNMDGWFGKGTDYMKNDLVNQIHGTPDDSAIGSMFTFAVDYGVIPFFIFLIFCIKHCIDRQQFLSYIFLFFGVLLNSINTQMLWFTIILLFTNKILMNQQLYFKKIVTIK